MPWAALADSDNVVLYSPVSVAELWHGVRPKEGEAVLALFAALVCVPVDAGTSRQAGEFLQHYNQSHGGRTGRRLNRCDGGARRSSAVDAESKALSDAGS